MYKKGIRKPVRAKQIPLKSLNYWQDKGWTDEPIIDLKQFGLTEDDDVNELGDLSNTIKTSLNQAINIPYLDEFELRAYAQAMDLKLDAFEDVEDLRERVLAA